MYAVLFFVATGIRKCNSENQVSCLVRDVSKLVPGIIFRTKMDTGFYFFVRVTAFLVPKSLQFLIQVVLIETRVLQILGHIRLRVALSEWMRTLRWISTLSKMDSFSGETTLSIVSASENSSGWNSCLLIYKFKDNFQMTSINNVRANIKKQCSRAKQEYEL